MVCSLTLLILYPFQPTYSFNTHRWLGYDNLATDGRLLRPSSPRYDTGGSANDKYMQISRRQMKCLMITIILLMLIMVSLIAYIIYGMTLTWRHYTPLVCIHMMIVVDRAYEDFAQCCGWIWCCQGKLIAHTFISLLIMLPSHEYE
jgi:hypothetical protein